jgi:Na+-transporting methylmalonyl-CoA/oxaloacetate decarboxylase gamma subunit
VESARRTAHDAPADQGGSRITITDAQRDISRAYLGGGPGVFVSALAWFAAALVEQSRGVGTAFIVLFFAGMLIYPLSTAISRFVFRREKEAPDNPLGLLALESTIAMIGGLFAAWLFLRFEPSYVFPLAAIAVGTHYAVFKTIYGDRLFWLLGALITLVGLLSIYDAVPIPGGPILAVGAIELLFALYLTMRARRAEG